MNDPTDMMSAGNEDIRDRAQAETSHIPEPDQEEMDERHIAAALDPDLDYFDATPVIMALGRKVRRQDATINRLANILEGFAKRQLVMNKRVVELQGEVKALQAKKSSLIIPERMKN
jgi:hypothetical protein